MPDIEITSVPAEVTLEDHMGGDLSIVNAARASLDKRSTALNADDIGLINYLMKNRHGTPFEHAALQFFVTTPIFVVREHHRHRIGHSYNEMSGRYTELEPRFYAPSPENTRTRVGKPGAYVFSPVKEGIAAGFHEDLTVSLKDAWETYQTALENGIAPEVARMVLPVNVFTKQYWTCNPRSLMHFLALRTHKTALWEIRQLAGLVEEHFAELFPHTYEAFVKNGRQCP